MPMTGPAYRPAIRRLSPAFQFVSKTKVQMRPAAGPAMDAHVRDEDSPSPDADLVWLTAAPAQKRLAWP